MNIISVETPSQIEKVFPVLKELRTHLDLHSYSDLVRKMQDEGYKIVAAIETNQVLGVMGFRYYTDFIRGKHLYIDDLVTSEKARSKGIGAELLGYAEKIAKENGCSGLRLCTGLENERGKKFYEREGWTPRSIAYNKKI